MFNDFLMLGFILNGIPLLFLVVSIVISLIVNKKILLILVALAAYHISVNLYLQTETMQHLRNFFVFSLIAPAILATASCFATWQLLTTKRDRYVGVVISILGYVISGLQSFVYIAVLTMGV